MIKTLVPCFLLALALILLASCMEESRSYQPVRFGFPLAGIGTHPNGIVGVAIANGYVEHYLNAVGFTLEVRPFLKAAPAINAALAEGELDIVEYFGYPAVLSKANGLDHTLICVTRWGSLWALAVAADSGIETIYDLAGKSVAYIYGTSAHMYLLRILNKAGLTPEDIEHVNNIPVIEGLAGVAIGRFDAAVILNGQESPFCENGVVRIVHRGFLADQDIFFEPTVLIARSEFYDEHPEVAVAIQKALLQARESGQRDVVAFYRTISEIIGLDFDTLISQANFNLHERYPISLDERYINSLADILTSLRSAGFTSGDIDFEAWHRGGRAIKIAAEYFYGG